LSNIHEIVIFITDDAIVMHADFEKSLKTLIWGLVKYDDSVYICNENYTNIITG